MTCFAVIFSGVLGFLSALRGQDTTNAPTTAAPVENSQAAEMFKACKNKDLARVQALIDQGAPVNTPHDKGVTPLMLAAMRDLGITKLLVSHGAQLDATDDGGDTALYDAIYLKKDDIALFLLDAGANPNLSTKNGKAPLMDASDTGDDTLVTALLAHHADVNINGKNRLEPIWWAVTKQRVSTAKLLIEGGADLNPQSPNVTSSTRSTYSLLNGVAYGKNIELMDLFLSHGIDINTAGSDGVTPLIRAVKSSATDMVNHLLDKGADPNRQDALGETALMWGTNFEHTPVLQNLVDHGAKLEITDKTGRTALLWACCVVYNPSIRFLVDHGADINAIDAKGETPLTYAGDRGDEEMVQLLKDKGAKQTALHIIAKRQPDQPLPSARAWALAVGAIYAQTNGTSPNLLGYDDPETVKEIQESLIADWDAKDKASFLQRIKELEDDGPRADEQRKSAVLTAMTDDDFNAKMAVLQAVTPQAPAMRKSYQRWKEKSGVAWDLCRAANLINRGYNAHYLTEQEAWSMLMDNARKVQGIFSSWQEMSDNFLDGREIWATDRDPKFEACAKLLLNPTDANSPWNKLAWKTDLSVN